MDPNSNFRKRRLLEDTVTSSNSSSIKRDVSTSTENIKPMTFDMWTQTEGRNEVTTAYEMELKFEKILQKLSRQESFLEEIRDQLFGELSDTSSTNIEYKIVTNGDNDDIRIEEVKHEEMVKQQEQITNLSIANDKSSETHSTTSSNITVHTSIAYDSENLTIIDATAIPRTQNISAIAVPMQTARVYSSESLKAITPRTNMSSGDADIPVVSPSCYTTKNLSISRTPNSSSAGLQVSTHQYHKPNHKAPSNKATASHILNDADSSRSSISQHGEESSCNNKMVPIGPNGTLIPSDVLDSIDWGSSSVATRKLLTNVFNRETLATHSLTGRPSPAFHGREKPLKNQLNFEKVRDIIYIVSKFCNVPEKEVRNAITTKCADENKMYNQRLRKNLKERNKENCTNNTM